jgi:hypothetical protein
MEIRKNDLVKIDTAFLRKTSWGRRYVLSLKRKSVTGYLKGEVLRTSYVAGILHATVEFKITKKKRVTTTLFSDAFKIIEAGPRHPLTTIFK